MKTILIIREDDLFRAILHRLLVLKSFNVIIADNSWIGLELANVVEPDLIISEVNIPQIGGGHKVLKLLRENKKTANIPFLFLTAENDSKSRSYALQLGANDYLIQPIDLSNLIKAIEAQLPAYQLR